MKKLVIMFLIILSSMNLVYSRTNSELTPIEQAEILIENKKYDEAITLLTGYVYDNPKSIFEVQKLLDKIRVEREKSNDLMSELITTLYDKGDSDEAYRIIEEYEKNNPFPDELTKAVLRNAREGAVFVINQKKFKEYMDAALANLNNNEFNKALDNYLLCLDFHRNEFDLLIDSEDVENTQEIDLTKDIQEDLPLNLYYQTLRNSSFSEINKLKNDTDKLKSYLTELKNNYDSVLNIINNENIDIRTLKTYTDEFLKVPETLKGFSDILNKLDQYNDLFSKLTVDGTKSKFISFAAVTMTGRKGNEEGYLYVINKIYPYYVENLLKTVSDKIDREFALGINEINNGDYFNSQDRFNRLKNVLLAQEQIASLWKAFVTIDENFNINGINIFKDKYSYIGDSQIGIDIADAYILAAGFGENSKENSDSSDNYRELLVNDIKDIQDILSNWNSVKERINSRKVILYNKSQSRIDNLMSLFNNYESDLITKEINYVDKLSTNDYISIFGFDYDNIDSSEDAISNLIKDAAIPTNKEDEIRVYFGINNTDERLLTTYNPEKSLSDLTDIENDYTEYTSNLQKYISKYKNEKDYIFENKDFNNRYLSVSKALLLANNNKILLANYKEEAEEKIRLSKAEENRAVTLYNNAVSSLEQENFTEARELIESGRVVSQQAISYSKNNYVINQLIPDFYNLSDQINQEEARIVIRDVRKLITDGKSRYLEGSYILASNIFKEAELRWAETNTDPHPEIPYWLALIRDALDIESGRYLSITEPLYSILAGYLSFAEDNYRRGIKEENTVEKLKAFAIADGYITKVLEVRPLNERARFLQLQVLKSKDPDTFQVTFNNEFIRYRDGVIKAIDDNNFLLSSQMNQVLSSYEDIVRDAYLRNPRLSGTVRREKLERLYKPVSSAGRTAAEINKIKSDNEEARKTINESYIRFQDLYKIAEGNQKSEVQRLVNISEVALGFRRLPVDTSNIRESDAIFTRAQNKLTNTLQSDIEGLNSIITELQQALTLNPQNEDIPVVIDEILVMLGEESNFQLAPAQDKLFREAQKDFIDGDYYGSRDKILDILQANSKNKNYPKLKELIKRVEIKIGEEITI